MADNYDVRACKRQRTVIDGENYYLIKGDDFVFATVPYENRPERLKERLMVDAMLENVTEMMGGRMWE